MGKWLKNELKSCELLAIENSILILKFKEALM